MITRGTLVLLLAAAVAFVVFSFGNAPNTSPFIFNQEEILLNGAEALFWQLFCVFVAVPLLGVSVAYWCNIKNKVSWRNLREVWAVTAVLEAILAVFLIRDNPASLQRRRAEITRQEIATVERQINARGPVLPPFDGNLLPIRQRFDSWGNPYQFIVDQGKLHLVSPRLPENPNKP